MYTIRKKIDMNKLRQNLSQTDWTNLYAKDNSELATEYFVNILHQESKNCTTKIKINNKNKKRKDWITQGLVKTTNKQKKPKQELLKNPENRDLEKEYKEYRNKLNSLIKNNKI